MRCRSGSPASASSSWTCSSPSSVRCSGDRRIGDHELHHPEEHESHADEDPDPGGHRSRAPADAAVQEPAQMTVHYLLQCARHYLCRAGTAASVTRHRTIGVCADNAIVVGMQVGVEWLARRCFRSRVLRRWRVGWTGRPGGCPSPFRVRLHRRSWPEWRPGRGCGGTRGAVGVASPDGVRRRSRRDC